MTQDVEAILAQASRPTQPHKLCLRDDLRRRHRELTDDLVKARGQDASTLAGRGKAAKVAKQVEALQKQMDAESLHLTLQALPRGRYRALLKEHPPRKDDQADRSHGFNVDAFIPALVRESVSEPKLSAEQHVQLLDALSDGQLLDLGGACINLNQDAMSVPFSSAALLATRSSDSE